MKNQNLINNFTVVKVFEEIDEDFAVQVISNPDIDGNDLSEMLSASIMGNIKDKNTKESVKLSNKVLMNGLLNRMNQLSKEQKYV